MALVGAILLSGFGVLVLLAVALIALPWHLHVRVSWHGRPQLDALAAPLGGLLPLVRLEKGKLDKQKAAKKANRNQQMDRRAVPWLLGLPQLLVELFAVVHVRALTAHGTFGFDDPADTGTVFGMLAPFAYAPPSDQFAVQVAPHFAGRKLNGEAEAVLSLIPGALLLPLARYAWSSLRQSQAP